MAKKLKWGTMENLNNMIDKYFQKEPIPNIAGLCLHLDISTKSWEYYVNEHWRTHRRSDEETIEDKKQEEEEIDREPFCSYVVNPNPDGIVEFSQRNRDDNIPIKTQVSRALKKARLRLDESNFKRMQTAKNPAGAIFYAKSALGYREKDKEISNNNPQIGPIQVLIQLAPPVEKQQKTLKPAEVKALEE